MKFGFQQAEIIYSRKGGIFHQLFKRHMLLYLSALAPLSTECPNSVD